MPPFLKTYPQYADSLCMTTAKTGNSSNDEINWHSVRDILRPGDRVDIQFVEEEAPLAYVVLMVLDEPIIICRAIDDVDLSELENGATAMVFVPSMRDMCLVKTSIRRVAEGGAYIALSPSKRATLLRRRRAIRVKTADDIHYRVQFEGKSNIYKGIAARDIGRGGIGLLVYAAGPIPIGTFAEISIRLPDAKDPTKAYGNVTHCVQHGNMPRTFRVGIRFDKVSPADRQAIASYVERTRSQPRSSG